MSISPPILSLARITFVRLALICACFAPNVTHAQGDQLRPWSIQRVATTVLRKIAAPTATLSPVPLPWVAAAPCPQPIARYGFVQHGEDMYIISGLSNGNIVNAVRKYSATTNVWTSLADIPVGSHAPAAAYLDGKIYVADGYGGKNRMRIYDIATNTWVARSARPNHEYYGSQGAAAGAFNGKVYLVGGGGYKSSQVSIYNVFNDTWSDGPALPSTREYLEGGYVQVGKFLYAVGGFNFFGLPGLANSNSTRRLDMATNTWSFGPQFTPLRADFALAAIGTKLIAIGGDEHTGGYNNPSRDVNELDISAWPDGMWKTSSISLPTARQGNRAGVASVGRAGGEIGSTGGLIGENDMVSLDENLYRAEIITSGGSSIVSAGPNGVLDPGETVTVLLGLHNNGSGSFCTTGALTGTLQTSGGVTSPTGAQNYGAICSESPAVFRNFTFTVAPSLPCGSNVTVSLAITDGATNYGTITYIFATGSLDAVLTQNFDGVIAPALPDGWLASNASGTALWSTSTLAPDTPPNDAFAVSDSFPDSSDKRLDTPTIAITSAYTKVSFRHRYNLGPVGPGYYSGGVLEVSSPNINGGAFTDITEAAVGGSFVTGGYVREISTCCGDPLSGRSAWSGDSAGYVTTIANLGPKVNGQLIKLRFHLGSRASNDPTQGWHIDTFSVRTPVCGGSGPTITSAVSRKTHGSSGTFDIDLPLVALDGNIGIEDRNGAVAGEHQLVITFASPVVTGLTSVTTGTGNVASSSVNGAVVTVNLAGVTNAQRLGVTLSSVSDGNNLGSVMIPIGISLGDTNGNGTVNSSDVSQVRLQSGLPVTTANFRDDVDPNGAINATDVSTVKLKSGTALP